MNRIDLADEQLAALRDFAAQQGRQWKSVLRYMWETGRYYGTATNSALLQQVRNKIGPSGLAGIRPADLAVNPRRTFADFCGVPSVTRSTGKGGAA